MNGMPQAVISRSATNPVNTLFFYLRLFKVREVAFWSLFTEQSARAREWSGYTATVLRPVTATRPRDKAARATLQTLGIFSIRSHSMSRFNLFRPALQRVAGGAFALLVAVLLTCGSARAQCTGCQGASIINCSGFNTSVSFVLCCNGNETISQYLPASASCADTAPISVSPCTIEGVNSFSPPLPRNVRYIWDPVTCTLYIY